jgi:protein Xni
MPDYRLLLLDGMNIVRRVYEANPVEDSPQKAQGALKSSLASVTRALNEHAPTHVLAAFDVGGRTWRHELLSAYHGTRKPMPEPLKEILPQIHEGLRAMGVHCLGIEGVEADDVIATAVLRWQPELRGPVVILSTDKDLAALLVHGAQVRDHFNKEWRDEAWVQKKFGVPASCLQDFLALSGDSSDNIPGVPGIGAKTAAKLLTTYGSLDALVARSQEVPGKLGENLRANLDTLALARRLVSFKTDVQLGVSWNDLRFTPFR